MLIELDCLFVQWAFDFTKQHLSFIIKISGYNNSLLKGEIIMSEKSKEKIFAKRQDEYKQEKEEIFREAREVAKENNLIDEKPKYTGKRVFTFRKNKPTE